MEMNLSPSQVAQNYAQVGAGKATRPTSHLIVLGILAGVLIALGGAATNTAVCGVDNAGIAKTICALIFPFGLGMVILMGAELFTGNCLMVSSLLDRRCTLAGMMRSWVIVYLANFAGSLLVAAACAWFGQMDLSGGLLGAYTIKVAAAKCSLSFPNALVLGILCNLLVCLGVLMAMSAKDNTGKILSAYLPIAFFVLCGFEHCVANMYYISAGLMAKAVSAYAQQAAAMGVDLSALTVPSFLLNNLLPVTIGNILGGAALACLMWFVHLRDRKPAAV